MGAAIQSDQAGCGAGSVSSTALRCYWPPIQPQRTYPRGSWQRRAAERLLAAGAELNWEPDYARGTPLDTARGLGTRLENVITWLKEKGARSADAQGKTAS